MKKIVLLLPVTSQPRLIKRVEHFIELGYQVTVLYQERDYFKLNQLPDGCEKIQLVKVENGKYFKRIFKTIQSIYRALSITTEFDIIYSFSFDLLIVSLFLSGKKRLYEIGDLRKVNSKLYDLLYQYLLYRQNKIIVTSSEFSNFIQRYYKVSFERIKIIENKIDRKLLDTIAPRIISTNLPDFQKKIIIGVIGLLRYRQIIDLLKVIKTTSNFEVYIYGAGSLLPEILEYVDNKKIFYFGEFQYPQDLLKIYEKIDFNFVMYNSLDLNVQLALPNKLYESIYFCKPLIVSENTFLERKVNEMNVGFAHSIEKIECLPYEIINCVKQGKYSEYLLSCTLIDKDEIVSDEVLIL